MFSYGKVKEIDLLWREFYSKLLRGLRDNSVVEIDFLLRSLRFRFLRGPDLYILFMYFKDKKKNAKMEKSAQRILDLLFDETDHDGNFSAIKFGAKSDI
jgi:hypothetical protein